MSNNIKNYKSEVTKEQLAEAKKLREMLTGNYTRLTSVMHREVPVLKENAPIIEDESATGFNPRTDRKWDNYSAVGVAEGFEETDNPDEEIEAWAYIIAKGLWRQLQGFFGRQAHQLIQQGLIDKSGHIDWDMWDSQSGEEDF